MGRTNTHRADFLGGPAGSSFDEIALIVHADKQVSLVGVKLHQ